MRAKQAYTTSSLQAERLRGELLRPLAAALAGSVLLAASAWVQVPMWPVPMTMQTYAVLLLGAVCGPRLAALTVAVYLAEAALGLPVLAGGKALTLGGPTFGYLVGFLPAAMVVGWAVERGWNRRWPQLLGVLFLAQALVYLPGLAWLDLMFLQDLRVTLASGLIPFLPGDALKLLLVAVSLRLLHRAAPARPE